MQKKLEKQRAFFRSGRTIPLAFRKKALKRLGRAIRQHEKEIYAALREDLNKSKTETFMCEVGMTLAELSYMLKHLEGWAKKKYVRSPLAQFSATSFTVKEPYGVALIMSPWNYPFMLTMEPLIGAIAAGNCAVVKPSAYAPATSAVIRRILRACFPEEYIFVVEGGRAENQALLDQRFDYIFFTGGVTVGKEVMAKAAKHLTPVTLELGGKSPCVVDRTANLELAAKRIAFGKLLNAGQTCVAPDYVLVAREVEDAFVAALQKQFDQLCPDPLHSAEYVHIVNQKHFDRLTGLMASGQIVYGGSIDPAALRTLLPYIEKERISVGFVGKDFCLFNHINDLSRQFALDLQQGEGDVAACIESDAIYQLSAFLPEENEPEFLRRCPGCLAVRWEDDFCDILPAGGGKPNGLAHTLAHLGLTREQSIAFGDGGNDVTMLEYAGIGVAMGNACDAAKAAADYVTDDITADGLAKALAHFGLI